MSKSKSEANNAFGDKVAALCIESYAALPKGTKPRPDEWTVLACIVRSDPDGKDLETVSLGTGSKCIGRSNLNADGRVLNDSHAEVIARRGFVRYLYDQIERAQAGRPSICSIGEGGKFKVSPQARFHFYASRAPCGAAALDSGARPLPGETTVATKPGRGDPTLSVSCSDKLARWIRCGLQGALLDSLLDRPVGLDSIVIGGDGPACERALRAALLDRDGAGASFPPIVEPDILIVETPFPYGRAEGKKACDASVVWCRTEERPLEVAVCGKRKGVTKKDSSDKSLLRITKRHLFGNFLRVVESLTDNFDAKRLVPSDKIPTYGRVKRKSENYLNRWKRVKKNVFKVWSEKPDIFNFSIVPVEGHMLKNVND